MCAPISAGSKAVNGYSTIYPQRCRLFSNNNKGNIMENKIIIDYTTVTTDSRDLLEEIVKQKIKEGWQPHGGLSFSKFQRNNGVHVDWSYGQAMVMYEITQ